MNWKRLLDTHQLRKYGSSKREIDDLRRLIDRDLEDAALPGLSADRSFATSFNAALQTAKMAIACEGYRAVGQGHHKTTLEAAELAVGPRIARLINYFEACRRKRNILDYDAADVISDTEAGEILEKAREFKEQIETWIRTHHPDLAG